MPGNRELIEDEFTRQAASFEDHLYSFGDPDAVLAEMRRVCRPGGRVAIMDIVVPEPEDAAAYNHRERLRDPSHVNALLAEGLQAKMASAGLELDHFAERDRALPLERWLVQSNPPEEIRERLRRELEGELDGGEPTGMRPLRKDGELCFAQRWAVAVGRLPA